MVNKKDILLKTIILVIGVGMILLTWFGFNTIDNQAQEIESLQEEINEKDNTIAYLEEHNQSQTEVIENTSVNTIQENVQTFVESTFAVEQENYEERKEVAENVLTQQMMNEIFPEDEQYNILYEYEVDNVKSYVNEQEDQASVYVTFEQHVKNLNNDQENDSYVTLEVFLQKEGDNWLVNDFQQLYSEPM